MIDPLSSKHVLLVHILKQKMMTKIPKVSKTLLLRMLYFLKFTSDIQKLVNTSKGVITC